MHDLPVDRLGPYPILQLAAAILILGGLAFAVWRANRDRKMSNDGQERYNEQRQFNEQRYYFDGPVGQVMALLKEHKDLLQRIEQYHSKELGVAHEMNNTLDNIKADVQSINEEKIRARRR